MAMPARKSMSDKYRYGYNGKEEDNEHKGVDNSIDFGARIYDPRISRFLSVDPLIKNYSYQSSYLYAGNCPIKFIDKNGGFQLDPEIAKTYPMIYKYLSTQIEKDIMNSTIIKETYKGFIKDLTEDDIRAQFANNSGAKLQVWDYPNQQSAVAYTRQDESTIEVATAVFKYTEDVLSDKGKKYTSDEKQLALTLLNSVLIHEVGHELLKGREVSGGGKKPEGAYGPGKNFSYGGEIGYTLEYYIFGVAKLPENKGKAQVVDGPQSGNDKLKVGVMKGVVDRAKQSKERLATLPTVPVKEKKQANSKSSNKKKN